MQFMDETKPWHPINPAVLSVIKHCDFHEYISMEMQMQVLLDYDKVILHASIVQVQRNFQLQMGSRNEF